MNKEDEFMIKLLMVAIDSVRQHCNEYVIVFNRDSNTQISLEEKDLRHVDTSDPYKVAAVLYTNIRMSGILINKIYYHKMNGLDVMVIGVLTGKRKPNQNIVLEAV